VRKGPHLQRRQLHRPLRAQGLRARRVPRPRGAAFPELVDVCARRRWVLLLPLCVSFLLSEISKDPDEQTEQNATASAHRQQDAHSARSHLRTSTNSTWRRSAGTRGSRRSSAASTRRRAGDLYSDGGIKDVPGFWVGYKLETGTGYTRRMSASAFGGFLSGIGENDAICVERRTPFFSLLPLSLRLPSRDVSIVCESAVEIRRGKPPRRGNNDEETIRSVMYN